MGTIKTDSDLLQRIELRHAFVREKLLTHTANKDGCWEFTGKFKIHVNHFFPQERTFSAHRISYAFFNNEDPAGLFVCHKCDNKKCINPDHLFLGTVQDSVAEMVIKVRPVSQPEAANNSSKNVVNETDYHSNPYFKRKASA